MKQYIIPTAAVLMVAATTTFAAIIYFNYSVGSPLSEWLFYDDGTGNAGTVALLNNSSYLDGEVLTGVFVIQAVGPATFDSSAKIISPSGDPTRTCWAVAGTATSTNAGEIRLSGVDTALIYNPVSQKLEWYGYNDWLGRVPFWTETYCGDDSIIDDVEYTTITGMDPTGSAMGRVKIIGISGWATVFDTSDSQGANFNASLFNRSLQRIRKNVGLLTRNLSDDQKEGTVLVGDKMFLIGQPIKKTSTIAHATMNDLRSLIVVGWDISIDQDLTSDTENPRWIIVLKDSNGNGGNIYVSSGVTRIDANIFAEGTLYSGEWAGNIYNDTSSEITNLPPKQLYIVWSLSSRNTIGGASIFPLVCPYNTICNTSVDATQYDLEYFRNYQPLDTTNLEYTSDPDRAYPDETYDAYSIIIETDRNSITNPPPGFE